MKSFNQRVQQTKFENWLHTRIYISKGCETNIRQDAIMDFIDDLRDFVQSKGYAFRQDRITIAKDWARFMFLIQEKSYRFAHFKDNENAIPEDYQLFNDTFTYEVSKSFLELYEDMEDYTIDSLSGPRILSSVFPFIWYYIDINNSKATRKVDSMMSDSDSDGGNENNTFGRKRNDDPYLADQANASSKFNRWD